MALDMSVGYNQKYPLRDFGSGLDSGWPGIMELAYGIIQWGLVSKLLTRVFGLAWYPRIRGATLKFPVQMCNVSQKSAKSLLVFPNFYQIYLKVNDIITRWSHLHFCVQPTRVV